MSGTGFSREEAGVHTIKFVVDCSGLISPDTSISGKYIYRGVFHDQKTQ